MEDIVLSRKELYEKVWTEPLSALAKKYNMSDNGLRKACIRMNIPLPVSGYWSKLKFGKADVTPELPSDAKCVQTIRLSKKVEGQGVKIDSSPQKVLQNEIEQDKRLSLNVPKTLFEPDTLIIKAQKALFKAKESKYYREGELLYSRLEGLDVRVASENIERALCFLDTFIKAMRVRGHSFKTTDNGCFVVVCEEEIKMTLKEAQNKIEVKDPYERTEYRANGNFNIKFEQYSNTLTAKDGSSSIEDQLSKIIARVELFGEKLKLETIESEKRRKEREEKSRIEEDYKQHQKNELHGFKQLLEDSRRWKEVQLLREYLDEIERKAASEGSLDEDMENWLCWSRKKADWFDPLVECEDEWLKDAKRNSLLSENLIKESTSSSNYRSDFFSYGSSSSKPSWPLPWYKK